MLRGAWLAATALIATTSLVAPAASLGAPPVTQKGTVTAILDARTIQVRLTTGTSERVQLIGLAAAAGVSCPAAHPAADLTHLAAGKNVWLVAEASHGSRRGGMPIVAYVFLPGGLDLGLTLLKRGDALVAAGKPSFKQASTYLAAQAVAQAALAGLWSCTPPAAAPPSPPLHGGNSNGKGRSK